LSGENFFGRLPGENLSAAMTGWVTSAPPVAFLLSHKGKKPVKSGYWRFFIV
jgi:hypothetical protein